MIVEEKTYNGYKYKIFKIEDDPDDIYFCGYVGIPEGHKLYKVYYDDIEFIDSTLLTFSTFSNAIGKDLWWIGFDTSNEGSNRDILAGYSLVDSIKLCENIIDQINRKYS